MLNECTAAYAKHGSKRLLVKNRDKDYKPKIDFIHELIDGCEVLYYIDAVADHMEGMNEHGLGILYTTTNYQKDLVDKNSNNIPIMKNALSCNSARDALKQLTSTNEGLHGLAYVSGNDATYLLERDAYSNKSKCKKISNDNHWNVMTNTSSMLASAMNPSTGEDYISCKIRKAIAEAALYGITDIEEALSALAYKYFSEDSHNNPLRNSDYETTCAQIGMDLSGNKCYFTPVPGTLKNVKFKKRLPNGYKPKIKFVKRNFKEPTVAPFKLFTTNLDENIDKFNLVNYLNKNGPERDVKAMGKSKQDIVNKKDKIKLAQEAIKNLYEKERILVSLIRKLKKDPIFFTAGSVSSETEQEIKILEKMLAKINDDYEDLVDIVHEERFGETRK